MVRDARTSTGSGLAHLHHLGTRHLPLDEINGPHSWVVVTEWRILHGATSETLLAAMVEDPGFAVDAPDFEPDGKHGPFPIADLGVRSYRRVDLAEAISVMRAWIVEEGPVVPDPDPILSRDVRPRLEGDEVFLFQPYRPTDTFGVDTVIGGWVEVVVVDRRASRVARPGTGTPSPSRSCWEGDGVPRREERQRWACGPWVTAGAFLALVRTLARAASP